MSRQTAMLLRLVGPLIEILCLSLLFAFPGEGRAVFGVPLRPLLLGGVGFGLLLVIAGLTLVRRPRAAARALDAEPGPLGRPRP